MSINYKTKQGMNFFLLSILFLSLLGILQAGENISFQSSNKQARVIELFTSQGCSSCPPTEKWINNFLKKKNLWQDFVPLVFHVDYWDYLGWKDIYAKKEFTQRQYDYKKNGNVGSIYTPGVLINGKEYRGGIILQSKKLVGVLSGIFKNQRVIVSYSEKSQNLELNIALLGFGVVTNILRGENAGEALPQEFVVLSYQKFFKEKKIDINQWDFDFLTENQQGKVKKFAIALWVSDQKSKKIVQATGFWL